MSVTEWTDTSETPQNCFKDECMTVIPILVVPEEEKSKIKVGQEKLLTEQEKAAIDARLASRFGGNPPKVASHISLNTSASEYSTHGSFTVQLKQEYLPKPSENEECHLPSFDARVEYPPLRKLTRDVQPINSVVCYACHCVDIPGKFDVKKADLLGVPPKLRSTLVKGLDLTLPDSGRVIKPSDVVMPATPGKILLIVHCTNFLQIRDSLIQHPAFAPYERGNKYDAQLAVIVHMTPAHIVESEPYIQWMKKFPLHTQHILVNAHHCSRTIIFGSSAIANMRLNTLHPTIFRGTSENNFSILKTPIIIQDCDAGSSSSQMQIDPPQQQQHTSESIRKDSGEEEKADSKIQSASSSSDATSPAQLKIIPASPLMKFHLSPAISFGVDHSEQSAKLDFETVMAPFETSVNPVFASNRATLQTHLDTHWKNMEALEKARKEKSAEPNPYTVIFLGTGAALPSKYRNVSSTFVVSHDDTTKGENSNSSNSQQIPGSREDASDSQLHEHAHGKSFFLDAGEGTYGQLSRLYKTQKDLHDVLRAVEVIFISHMHADHHLGVIRLLLKRQEVCGGNARPLAIIAPPSFKNWISEYEQIESLNYELYNAYDLEFKISDVVDGSKSENKKISPNLSEISAEISKFKDPKIEATAGRKELLESLLLERIGLEDVKMVPVIHCADAFGVIMRHSRLGWKLVFSGDTRPCDLLNEAGKGCDLLIHEATFEDQLTTEAIEKNHATTTEAIESSKKMGSGFLLMTHFSQRYPKIPVFDDKFSETCGIAFDLMCVRKDDFPILPKLLPCLKDLFDEIEENEDPNNQQKGSEDLSSSKSAPPKKKQKKEEK